MEEPHLLCRSCRGHISCAHPVFYTHRIDFSVQYHKILHVKAQNVKRFATKETQHMSVIWGILACLFKNTPMSSSCLSLSCVTWLTSQSVVITTHRAGR